MEYNDCKPMREETFGQRMERYMASQSGLESTEWNSLSHIIWLFLTRHHNLQRTTMKEELNPRVSEGAIPELTSLIYFKTMTGSQKGCLCTVQDGVWF